MNKINTEETPLWILETLRSEVKVWIHKKQLVSTLFARNFSSWKTFSLENFLSYLISFSKSLEKFFHENPNAQVFFNFEKWFYWEDWEKLRLTPWGLFLNDWYIKVQPVFLNFKNNWEEKKVEEYLDFWNGIIYWALCWLWVWFWADYMWLSSNPAVEWVVRFLSGNWDTIWWIAQRIKNKTNWWKDNQELDSFSIGGFGWMAFWPSLQLIGDSLWSNSPFFNALYTSAYSNADNAFSWLWALISLVKQKWFKTWLSEFINQPFQRANLIIILTLFVINLIFFLNTSNLIDDQSKAAIHWTLLNIDSIIAALYMRNYASRHYKNFVSIISDNNMLESIRSRYLHNDK